MTDSLRVQRLSGSDIAQYLPELARLRMTVFRDFPYLYDGSLDYEKKYLQTYVDSPDSVIVVVHDRKLVVGASSGIPLAHETEDVKQPFVDAGYDVARMFYCAESVLLRPYRGRGLGVRFFEEREGHARALGRFDTVCFCSVERPLDHPRRPADYVPNDRFWTKRGYVRHPELRATISWRDVDEFKDSPKQLIFWLKPMGTA